MSQPAAVIGLGGQAGRLFGLTARERLERLVRRCGLPAPRAPDEPFPASGTVLLMRLDHAIEEILLRRLAARPGTVLVRPGAGAAPMVAVAAHVDAGRADAVAAALRGDSSGPDRFAGLDLVDAAGLASAYNSVLRKRAPPFVLPLAEMPQAEAERRVFAASYKGVTDFITKWLWPRPALAVTRWAAGRGVTPNMVTAVSLVFVFAALALFAVGAFWAGLAAAWIMTFLDTVDGKLARVTLTSTRFGNVFDHGIDLIHPPLWYAAWWYGTKDMPLPADVAALFGPALGIVVIGYILGRLIEGVFIWRFKLEIHAWRRADSLFRLVTARRNPNLLLLTAAMVAGRPDLGFLAIAGWTLLSLGFHVVRLAQALLRRRRGPLRSWLDEPMRRDPAPGGPAPAAA